MSKYPAIGIMALIGLIGGFFRPTAFAAEWQMITGHSGEALKALVFRPHGDGPFPAIVAMHGCGGITGRSGAISQRHADWGKRLQAAGFLVVFPDSFSSRGLGAQCSTRHRQIKAKDRSEDAFIAAEWLMNRPDIIKTRIGLLGWSNGGTSVLNAAKAGAQPVGGDFKQAVTFYPGCTDLLKGDYKPRIPVAIFHGLADDWTSAGDCSHLTGVQFTGYVGAYNDFDYPNMPLQTRKAAFSVNRKGIVHLGTDVKARYDAIPRAMALFKAM